MRAKDAVLHDGALRVRQAIEELAAVPTGLSPCLAQMMRVLDEILHRRSRRLRHLTPSIRRGRRAVGVEKVGQTAGEGRQQAPEANDDIDPQAPTAPPI